MKRLIIILFIVPVVCNAEGVKLTEKPLDEVNKLLSLELKNPSKEKVSGFYSVENNILNGSFRVGKSNRGYSDVLETNYDFTNIIEGEFKLGKKSGIWKYQYTYDDGIDLYESHVVEITYHEGGCSESRFKGNIGYIMPITEHIFKDKSLCTPFAIRKRAWELWGKEYNILKKKGEL